MKKLTANQDIILEGLGFGTNLTWQDVINDYQRLTYEEVLQKVNILFPTEDNKYLAQLIYNEVP